MPDRRHMHAYLVGAAGLDLHFDECELSVRRGETLQHLVMRNGITSAVAFRGHARALRLVTRDRCIYGSRVSLGPAVHKCDVAFIDLASGKLLAELAMRDIVLGDDDQSRRFLVEAVHNSRPQFAIYARELAKVME